nr:MAG TPA: hypothetical protein [Caudoviricetes sp.]
MSVCKNSEYIKPRKQKDLIHKRIMSFLGTDNGQL